MSLQLAAQHMASRGRGPDTTLVHMAPQEVAGLQALAKAHGGSLTTNPDTGLPEAGFLSSILPMVIGAGITAATGGAAAPWMIGLGVGGAQTLATGSLKKGLMAGLGAYGGAGLAGGLTAAGAAGATGAVAPGIDGTTTAMSGGFGPGVGAATGAQAASSAPGYNVMTGGFNGVDPFGLNPAVAQAAPVAGPTTTALTAGAPQVATATPMADRFAQIGQGFQNLGTEAGRDAFMGNAASKGVEATGVGGLGGLARYGGAAVMPMLFQEPKPLEKRPEEAPYRYTYDAGRVADPQAGYTGAATGERTYFNPVYTRTAAGGGLMDIGPVEAMSDRNQAETMTANGGMRYAEGGETKAVAPVEQDPYYTMSGQSGDAFKYLMGQGPKPTPAAVPVAPAPVQSTVQPATSEAGGLMSRMLGALGAGSSNATMRPYTFDPATGTFTAQPVIAPTTLPVSAGSGFYYGDGGAGGYGGDSGSGVGDSGGVNGSAGTAGVGDSGSNGDSATAARGGLMALAAGGGVSHLGDYSDGGRLLRGPGDGVSDDIPATIGEKRPARLADGEFVVSADVVSGLGNGSTEAGARKLYAMMDRVRKARTGTKKMGKTVNPDKLVPI